MVQTLSPWTSGTQGGSRKGQKARKAEKVESLQKEEARRARPNSSPKEARAARRGTAARVRRTVKVTHRLHNRKRSGLKEVSRASQENVTSAASQVTSGQTAGNV